MRKSLILISIPALLLSMLPVSASARMWTLVNGSQPFEAEFVDFQGGLVTLQSPDKRRWPIAFEKFSPEDKQWVLQLKGQNAAAVQAATPKLSSVTLAQNSPSNLKGLPEIVAKMQPGTIFTQLAKGETATTYHVYTPTKFNASNPPPMIIAFSPGGDGKGILGAVKDAAEKVGWIVVGCDKLSNALEKNPDLERKVEGELMADILASLAYNPARIYLAGFSGGAMRSYGLANRLKNPFAGILAYGGWLGGPKAQSLRYCNHMSVAMVNGRKDVAANSWSKGDTQTLKRSQCIVKEFPWDGGHAIPPKEITESAVLWLDSQWHKVGL